MVDGALIALSPLLFEDGLHLALGVLDNGSLDAHLVRGEYGVSAHGVLTRANLVDVGQLQHVADFYVVKTRYGEEVARREEVFSAGQAGNHVL